MPSVLGDIANGLPCESANGRYALLTRTGRLNSMVKADSSGALWVFTGTDSGYEGTTELYYAFIAVLFSLAS